jgi:hypothetical protein
MVATIASLLALDHERTWFAGFFVAAASFTFTLAIRRMFRM